jgi:hypothetical protein
MALKVKSVYSPMDRKNDGLRILATRFRGRGMRTNRYPDGGWNIRREVLTVDVAATRAWALLRNVEIQQLVEARAAEVILWAQRWHYVRPSAGRAGR